MCLITTQSYAISCACVTMGCLCGSVAVWRKRVAACQSASALFLEWMKSSQIFGPFSNPGACHLPNEWPSFLDSWTSQSMMSQDKWAHSFAFHCRLISVGPFAYLYGTTLVKHNNNKAQNTSWIFYFRLILMMTQNITHNSQSDWSCRNYMIEIYHTEEEKNKKIGLFYI